MFIPSSLRLHLSSLMLAAAVFIAPSLANAAQCDCSQPQSSGATPTASDCLNILKTAVGSADCNAATCSDPTICDTDGNAHTTASDALLCLKKAVGQDVTLNCSGTTTTTVPTGGCETPDIDGIIGCPGPLNTCTSGLFVSVTGSDLDTGWNGLAHNQDLVAGAAITIAGVRRCVNNKTTTCTVDSDCPGGDTCRPFCDCDDPNNSVCEITGPTVHGRCVRDLALCNTNTDCGASGQCERFFGPPLPLSAANTPACITTFFAEDLTGTADSQTGEGEASAFLRSRVHLGITNDKPCPRCGGLNAQVGQTFTCDGGPNDGDSCTVEAVSPVFGGVSSSCPPEVTDNISGQGLAVRFQQVTTGTTSKTAALPCVANNICTDDGSACTTNADCLRCTNDFTACATNGDCTGGTCAAAPDQPISCGFYCHCGFCNNDPNAPCFDDGDCPAGQTCGAGNSTTGTQDQPNACGDDLTCGRADPERCCTTGDPNCPAPTPQTGKCSLKEFVQCSNNTDCSSQGAGTCNLQRRPCFQHTIARTGVPSPLGKHCVDDPAVDTCTSNTDCGTGACVDDTAKPSTVALFCVPKTASGAINAAGGIPGPGAITFKGVVFACRCGDGVTGCDEQCDDSNNTNGDGCDQACRTE